MSIAAVAWAIAQRLQPRDKLALVILANRANAAGICWPSVASIVVDTGLAERSVQGAIRSLAAAGMLTVEGNGGRSLTRTYRLQIGAPAAPFTPVNGAGNAPYSGAERVQSTTETAQDSTEWVQNPSRKGAAPAPGIKKNREGKPSRTVSDRGHVDRRDLFPDREAPASPTAGSKTAAPEAPRSRKSNCTAVSRIPHDFAPNETGIKYAKARGVGRGELDKFRNHWQAEGGPRALKADWQAAWRTWCDRCVEWGQATPPSDRSQEPPAPRHPITGTF
jgi:hypothetical protein